MGKIKPNGGSAKRSGGRRSTPSTQSRRPYTNSSHELIFHRDDVTASGRTMTNSELREQSSQSARFNRLRPEKDGTFAPPPVFGAPALNPSTPEPASPQHVGPAYGSPSPPQECPALDSSLARGENVKDMVLAYCIMQADGTYRIANIADVQLRQPHSANDAGVPGLFDATGEVNSQHVLKPVFQDKYLAARLNLSESTAAWALDQRTLTIGGQSRSQPAASSTESDPTEATTPARVGSAHCQSSIDAQLNVSNSDGLSTDAAARPFYRYSSAYLKALSFTAPFKLTEDDYINAEIAQAIITDALDESMAAPLSSNSLPYTSPTYANHKVVSPTHGVSRIYDWRNAMQSGDSMAQTYESAGEDGGIMLWPQNPSLGER